jgi:hypothetical protein
MYSIITVMVLDFIYIGQFKPNAPCSILLGPEDWKLLYCMANGTEKEPGTPYSMKEAVGYLGRLGGLKRAPCGDPPGMETIWIGLMKFYILLHTKSTSGDSVGQV